MKKNDLDLSVDYSAYLGHDEDSEQEDFWDFSCEQNDVEGDLEDDFAINTPVTMLPKPPSAKAAIAKHIEFFYELLINYLPYKFLAVSFGNYKELYKYNPSKSYAIRVEEDAVGEALETLCDEFDLLEERLKITTAVQKELVAKIKRQPKLKRKLDDFYKHAFKTNCKTGVIDISRTGEISVEERTESAIFDFFVDADFLPDATLSDAPAFYKYCKISLDENMQKIQLLLEMIGSILFSSMEGKCFFVCIGVPNSGKSLILKFVKRMLGEELVSSIPLHELNDIFQKAKIFGKRVNIVTEVSKKKLKGDDILKAMTSGDTINAAFKGKDSFDFPVFCKLWFAANEFPSLDELDTTGAFYNRMVVLCYGHSVTKDEKDPELEEELWAEKDVIFSLAIKAYAELVKCGFDYSWPDDSKEFMARYRARENSFQRFLEEDVAFEPNHQVRRIDIVKAYRAFCLLNNLARISAADIDRILDALCKAEKIVAIKIKPEKGKGRPADGYSGLRLLSEGEN